MSTTEIADALSQRLTEPNGKRVRVEQDLCEGVREIVGVPRALILTYDANRNAIKLADAAGFEFPVTSEIPIALEELPTAQRILRGGPVVTVAGAASLGVPKSWVEILGLGRVAVTPILVGNVPLGLLVADLHEAATFSVDRKESFVAAAAVVGLALRVNECMKAQAQTIWLNGHLRLARRIHDDVIQRFFAVSMALSAEDSWDDRQRTRCLGEVSRGLSELRSLLAPSFDEALETDKNVSLRDDLRNLAEYYPDLPLILVAPTALPPLDPDHERMAQHFLEESLRNVRKHARPSRVTVTVAAHRESLSIVVENDGVPDSSNDRGLGLRLLEAETLYRGGRLERSSASSDQWRIRLVLPTTTKPRHERGGNK